jgi:hypothetical protein
MDISEYKVNRAHNPLALISDDIKYIYTISLSINIFGFRRGRPNISEVGAKNGDRRHPLYSIDVKEDIDTYGCSFVATHSTIHFISTEFTSDHESILDTFIDTFMESHAKSYKENKKIGLQFDTRSITRHQTIGAKYAYPRRYFEVVSDISKYSGHTLEMKRDAGPEFPNFRYELYIHGLYNKRELPLMPRGYEYMTFGEDDVREIINEDSNTYK